jgi:hypothetical protein
VHDSIFGNDDFDRLLDELVEVSDKFGVPFHIPDDPHEEDLQSLQFLLEIARKGQVTLENSGMSFAYAKGSDVDARSFLEGEKEMRATLPKLDPLPKLMGVEVDPGPFTVHMRRAVVDNLEQTVEAFIAASEGEPVKINLKPLAPVEFVFLKFARPTASS